MSTKASVVVSPALNMAQVENGKSRDEQHVPNATAVNLAVISEDKYKTNEALNQRNRKLKRPFSPELIARRRKILDKKKQIVPSHFLAHTDLRSVRSKLNEKPFSCELCNSPYIVNPTRCRLPYTKAKRRPGARKIVDPTMNKVMVVCNACGLSRGRKKTNKSKQTRIDPSDEDRTNYIKEAISFAHSLASSLQEPLMEQFYCPVYKYKPCRCLQSYIMGNDESSNEFDCTERALQLLALLKEAKSLSKQKYLPDDTLHDVAQSSNKDRQKVPKGAKLRRTQAFEDFVLSKRIYLREDLRLCERACQRILSYSNNFLHKKIKSSNTQSRLEKTIGKNATGALTPIVDLTKGVCCLDNCLSLASTHPKLLESWRKTAGLGQWHARRVLAEMLTPSGGTKANCYKFISMVTGCSFTTINLVSEHMKQTHGDREPPEHGLKRRHRERTKHAGTGKSSEEDSTDNWSDMEIPSREELRTLDPKQAQALLQKEQEKLDRLKKQLADKQLQLEKKQILLSKRMSLTNDCGSKEDYTDSGENETNPLNSQHLLHILKLPTNSCTGITPITKQVMSEPTISVITSSGNFEPLGSISNISVSLPDSSSSQSTFSNVVIVPDSSLDVSSLGSRIFTECESLVPAASYEVDISSSPNTSQTTSSSVYQLYAVMDTPNSTIFHFNN